MSELITGDTSDGYHTFNELYEHRHSLFASLLQITGQIQTLVRPWKTWRDQNGEVWEGWFIAGLDTIHGQISYHMPAEWWDRLPDVPEIERNAKYDGHTSADVLHRLRLLLGN
jgi:hypothetical protein